MVNFTACGYLHKVIFFFLISKENKYLQNDLPKEKNDYILSYNHFRSTNID